MALSVGFIRFVSSTNATQATGLLTIAPVGLPPTEHASLRWTHWFPENPIWLIDWELTLFRRFSPALVVTALFPSVLAVFRSRAVLQLEILALRHQLGVLQRSVKRPKLTATDRLLWAQLCQFWKDWRSALVVVKPETVIGWHRKGFRLFWTWKVRRGLIHLGSDRLSHGPQYSDPFCYWTLTITR